MIYYKAKRLKIKNIVIIKEVLFNIASHELNCVEAMVQNGRKN